MGEELDFETAIERLEVTVRKLEGDAVSLEESLTLFEEGVRLSRLCAQKLEEAELRVQRLGEGQSGSTPDKAE